jgi:hypothetical protein
MTRYEIALGKPVPLPGPEPRPGDRPTIGVNDFKTGHYYWAFVDRGKQLLFRYSGPELCDGDALRDYDDFRDDIEEIAERFPPDVEVGPPSWDHPDACICEVSPDDVDELAARIRSAMEIPAR